MRSFIAMDAFFVLCLVLLTTGLPSADPADLVWSTYLGGSNMDNSYVLALDGSGSTYLTGPTLSTDFPTTSGAYDQTHNGSYDVYVTKFNAAGNALEYSTLLGGTLADHAQALILDGDGNAYLTGYTYSKDDFPITVGVVQDTFAGGSWDIFVTKLNASGSDLEYSTYLGGSYNDAGYGIDVDGSGNVSITGRTESADFPVTSAAFDTTYHGGGDALVAQINVTASSLVYCTFLGGYSSEYGRSVVLDDLGNAYLSGRTESPDFPVTPAAYDTSHNGWTDAFAVKLNATGSGLDYSTYLGGSEQDDGYNIIIDGASKAYVIGGTKSTNFPVTAGAFDETKNGGEDAFLVQLDATGSDLDYGTFIGGASDDQGYGIDLDTSGKAYLVGHTYSNDFPVTADAYDTTHNGNRDVFVIKFDISGNSLDYSTFLGGTSWEYGYGIAQDGSGNVHLGGSTNSADFPVTAGAYDDSLDGYSDVWVAKISIGVTITYGAIAGNVSEDGGGPIAGAAVSAVGPSSGSDTTDAGGNYLIAGLLPGSYDVTATADGYYPDTQNGITVIADDTTTVDFLLTPIVVAPPEAVDDLTIMLSKTDIVLQWSAVTTDTSGAPIVVDGYLLYRDTVPDVFTGTALHSTTDLIYVDDTGVVGDTGTHYYYVVIAVATGETSAPSNTVGEFDDFLMTQP